MSLDIGQDYTFTTQAPAVLGTTWTGKLLAVLDYETAAALQPDIFSVHAAVRRYLTDQSKDATALTYYRVQLSGGDKRVLAAQWLVGDPVPVSNRTAVFTLTGVDAATVQLVKDTLTQTGISFTVIY